MRMIEIWQTLPWHQVLLNVTRHSARREAVGDLGPHQPFFCRSVTGNACLRCVMADLFPRRIN